MSDPGVTRAGFTMLEVIVALAIIEVGLVGTVGVLVLAHRALAEAEVLDEATHAAASAADSLLADGGAGAGSRELPWGRVRWSSSAGRLDVRAEAPSGVELLAWVIPGAAP